MFGNKKLFTRLLISFLLVSIIPALIIAISSLVSSTSSLSKTEFSKLESLRETKADQIEKLINDHRDNLKMLSFVVKSYQEEGFKNLETINENKKKSLINKFNFISTEISGLSNSKIIQENLESIGSFSENQKKTNNYLISKNELDLFFSKFLTETDVSDIYIIKSRKNRLIYTTNKEIKAELGNNLIYSDFKDSGLFKVYKKVLKNNQLVFEDFSEYKTKTGKEMSLFAAIPINYEKEQFILVARFNKKFINELMLDRSGLGISGETYLAGEKGSVSSFRSDLKTIGKGKFIVGYHGEFNLTYWKEAFSGKKIKEIFTDSQDKLVMVVAEPINLKGLNWIIVTKKDLEEVITKKIENSSNTLYKEFIKKFQFSDLFFIHSKGEIFYSVNKKKDYHTNILTGKYSESNLSKLVEKIKVSHKEEIVDFNLYKPIGNKPAAFIGIPIMKDGKVIFIIATEYLDNEINKIMMSDDIDRKTEETYLVGNDYLIRSNSNRNPQDYSLETSLKYPQKYKLKTLSVKQALKGIEDTIITKNYMNEKVISSFKKLNIKGLEWIIISELNTSEAFGSVSKLSRFMCFIVFLSITGIIFISYKITKSIVKPINNLEKWSEKVAKGNNSIIEINTSDEDIKNLTNSFSSVVKSIQDVTDICENIAGGDFSKGFEIRSEDDLLGISINHMRDNFLSVIKQTKQLLKGDFSIQIEKKSDNDLLASALIDLVSALKKSTEKNTKEAWIRTGQSELYDLIRGQKAVPVLANRIINFLAKYTEAEVGAIFIKDDNEYKLNASYAYTFRKNSKMNFKEGEGLIGQAVIEKEIFVMDDLPEDYIYIQSGIGKKAPKNLIIIPCMQNKNVNSVIELAYFNKIDTKIVEFLNLIKENIAIALHTSESRNKINQLLERSMKQSEELQYQQEILKQTNEELEEQTQKLQESEKYLQQQQEELKQTNEELEEQTLLLQNEKDSFYQQNKELEKIKHNLETKSLELKKSNKYKSEFLANMSHELRTPLNSILILAKLLQENKENNFNEKELEKIGTIYRSGNDLLNLINEILDLSKIEAGKTELNIKEFELKKLIKFFERSFTAIAEDKNLSFEINIDDNVPTIIKTDEQKLSQILKNLCSNALKFTEKGGIKLNISKSNNKEKNIILFEVKDTGIGIPEKMQEFIFEAFQQVDGSISRKYCGTGLGLSISKNLSKLLGGKLEVNSQESKGSSFKVYIPIYDSNNTFSSIANDEKKDENILKISSSEIDSNYSIISKIEDDKETIKKDDKVLLIIEDNIDFASILLKLARKNGYKGIVSLTGKNTVKMLEKYSPQGILLDIGLPDIDGWTILGKIKNNLKSRHIPVYIISGNENAGLGLKLGAAGFIKKPASQKELQSAFEKLEFINRKELKNILVIEDDKIQLEGIGKLLNKMTQIQLHSAMTGNKAIELINQNKYDCIVLDLKLPDINGIELLSVLKKTSKIEEVPVIIYTAKDLSEEERNQLKIYSEKIILKNVDSQDELLDQITLFLHIMEDNLSEKNKKLINNFKEKGSEFKGKKILVADDDIRNIFALTSVLEEKEIEVYTAENGQKAIEILEKNSDINMIIMDIMMPVLNGYEAIKKIRKIDKFENLPIIALTAKAMKEDYNTCIEAGASDYLTKPLNVERLLSLMQVWLYKSF